MHWPDSNQKPNTLDYIKEHKVLNGSEELLAYYDATVSCDGSEAAILTTERVIYHRNGENTFVLIKEIKDIRHREESLIGDIIEIASTSGKTIKIEISPLNQGATFKNVLNDTWEQAQSQK